MAARVVADHARLRVLVKGSSSVVLTSWMGGPRTDLAYPRVVEQVLRSRGHDAVVEVSAMTADTVSHALREWHDDVADGAPDVVVLHYGLVEAIHVLVPRSLERHANSERKRPGPVRTRYRRLVLRPVYIAVAKLQVRVDARRRQPVMRRRLRRYERDLERLVDLALAEPATLVLIPLLVPPGRLWDRWFPGCATRLEATNAAIQDLVRRRDLPRLLVFDTLAAAASLGKPADEDLTPDGGHFTPEVHRAIGEAMAEVIVERTPTPSSSALLPLAVRVLVMGDGDEAAAIQVALRAGGRPADVRTEPIASTRVRQAFRTWERDVVMWSPDVVVLRHGVHELAHRFPPTRRAHLVATLAALIERIGSVASPLVLVGEVSGRGARVEAVNAALREAVARVDRPEVRVLPAGADVAATVLGWAADQPHLAGAGQGRR